MKGLMFNLLEDYVSSRLDEEAWEQIIDKCRLETDAPLEIVGPGTYSDRDFMEMVSQAAAHLDTNDKELLRQLGSFSIPVLARRYPSFFAHFKHPKTFLKTIGIMHHTEIKKLYKDAAPPLFNYNEIDERRIILKYVSDRHLEHMVAGLLQGLGDYYHIPLTIENTKYTRQAGRPACEFTVRFA